ncbi:MAG TPA: MFS transporter [Trebonia sp.]|nr:MFS transporter [Trebonia sp.]
MTANRGKTLGPHYKWIALSNTTLGVLMATINQSIVLISLPAIFRGIGLNPLAPGNTSYLLWMFMGFMVVTAVLVVSFGRMGDMFGRVRMYNMGFAVFTVASIALTCTFMRGVDGALWLIIWRVVQGVGGAFLFANSTAILTDAFPANQRGTALGLNSIAAIAGSFIGLILGGLLAPVNWHLVFLISAPIGAFATVWAYFMLHDIGERKQAKMDWWGNILFGVGLIAIMVGITYGLEPYGTSAMGWGSPWVLTALFGGLALLIVFVWVETKVAEPLFRISLFKIRPFAYGNIANLALALSRGGMQFMLIIWLQGIWLPLHGYSYSQTPLWAGVYLVPLTIGFLLSAPLSGILSDRMGAKAFTVGGTLLAAVTFLVLAFLPVNFTYWQFALIIAFNGFGTGLFASPNRAEMMNAVPGDARGAAGGMIATFMNSAMVLSIGVFFSLMVSGLASKLPGSLLGGLTAQGVPAVDAAKVAHLPPIGVLFAAFLGYNPIQTLLGNVLGHMTPAHVAYLTGRQFFPNLITSPFHSGLGLAFGFAIAACLVACVASALTGRRKPGAHESLGAELAATASEGSGIEPAELVIPAEIPSAGGVNGVNGVNGSAFAMAGVPHGGGRHAAEAAAETLPRAATGAAPQAVVTSNGHLAAPVISANGAGSGGLAVSGYVRQGGAVPLPGATVTLIDPAGRQAGIGRSGEDGRYRVPVPAQGTYTLIAMAKSHEPYASAVQIADRAAEVDVLLSGASRLTGNIRAAGTGQPLPGVTVMLADAQGAIVGSAVTGEAGQYEIENLVAGQYTIALSAPSYQPLALSAAISDGQPATLDAELRTGARVGGTARSTSGAVVADARVTLVDPDGNVAGVAATGPDGTYSFENLPEGEYTVIASGYPPAASRLKVAGGDPHSHDVELGHSEA